MLGLLYFGQEVLIPLALAVLFAFLLAPVVGGLERLRLGRALSTVLVVFAALALVVGFGWIVERRFAEIVSKLPDYRQSIQAKFHGLTRSGGMVEAVRKELRQSVQDSPATQPGATTQVAATTRSSTVVVRSPPAAPSPLTSGPAGSPTPLTPPSPDDPWAVRLYPKPATTLELIGEYVGKLLGPVATAGLVVVFIVFMLIGRENLRDRMILLAGGGRLHLTTQAFDDAATRIGRFLTAQSLINISYGVVIAVGLWVIDVTMGGGQGGFRTALLAGLICAVMRYVPYIGPWLGAALPLALAFAAFPGNDVFFVTLAMFVGIEILVSQAVEPHVLGSSTGLSPMAVLVAAVFWTWLWGPIGLLLSTPLTVLLVVMGKHVPQLAMLDVLLGDEPVLNPTTRIYQRLIAGDDEEAAELAIEYLGERPLEAVYDQILIPALAEAESDWHRGKLDDARHLWIRQGLVEIVQTLGDRQQSDGNKAAGATTAPEGKGPGGGDATPADAPATRPLLPDGSVVNVRCLPAHDEADRIVGLMVAQVLGRRGYTVTVANADSLASDMAASFDTTNAEKVDVVIVSALPPKAALHARYLLKPIIARAPDLKVVIGLWTNNKPGAPEVNSVPTATSLGALHKRLDELTPMILLSKAPAPAKDRRAVLPGGHE